MKTFKSISTLLVVFVLSIVSSVSAFATNEKRVVIDENNYYAVSGYETETFKIVDNQEATKISEYNSHSPVTVKFNADDWNVSLTKVSYEHGGIERIIRFTVAFKGKDAEPWGTDQEPNRGMFMWGAYGVDYITFSEPGYYILNVDNNSGEMYTQYVHIHEGGAQVPVATPDAKKPVSNPVSKSVTVVLNSENLSLTPSAQVLNGTTFVPLRGVFENMGAQLAWDQAKKLVTITYEGKVVELTIGSKTAKVNGEEVLLTVEPFVDKNYTFVPLRFISQSIGATVNWDQSTSTVDIQTK